MSRSQSPRAPVVPIVLFPGTSVVRSVAPSNNKLIAERLADMAIMAHGVVVSMRGGGLVETGMGWLWFPKDGECPGGQ